MSKTTFGKIVCALSAAAVLAALQFAAPASAAIEPFIAGQPDSVQQAASTLPAPVQPAVDAQADSDDANAMAPEPDTSTPAADPRQVECMAKVIIHEAANQPRRGRAAVAQVIHARMHDARFAKNALRGGPPARPVLRRRRLQPAPRHHAVAGCRCHRHPGPQRPGRQSGSRRAVLPCGKQPDAGRTKVAASKDTSSIADPPAPQGGGKAHKKGPEHMLRAFLCASGHRHAAPGRIPRAR
jgi:hypothetical protein